MIRNSIDHLLGRSKNLSSVLSCSNSPGPLSPACSSSSSFSSSSSGAPKADVLEPLRTLGALGEAKLVSPPAGLAAAKPPLNPEKPDPSAAKPDVPAAEANPVAAGWGESVDAGDLKTEGVELPREPKGDCSELANAARLDAAKADDDVAAAGFASSSLAFAPIAPNGETDDVFANALVMGACQASQRISLYTQHTIIP